MAGRVVLSGGVAPLNLSWEARELLERCLDPNPMTRADIVEVRNHVWVRGVLDAVSLL